MHEDGDRADLFGPEGPMDDPFRCVSDPWPKGARTIRGCRWVKWAKDSWALWTSVDRTRYDFRLRPSHKLSRQGVEIYCPEWVLCLDDAALFITGYEQGLRQGSPGGRAA